MSQAPARAQTRMRLPALVAEAVREAWAQKVPSLLVLLVVAATCATALTVLGHGVAQQREMSQALESAGARVLTVTDTRSRGVIDATVMSIVRSMTGVESAVALSAPVDVVNVAIPGTPRVPAWQADRPELVTTLSLGRQDSPGQASASPQVLQALRLATSSGAVRSPDELTRYDVTATGTPSAAFEDLAVGLVVRGGEQTVYRQLRVTVTDLGAMPAVQAAVTDLVGGWDPQAITVQTPSALTQASALFSDQVSAANRATLLLILAAGAFFSALVTLTDVLLHRRQMGRRRALGITRGALTALTTARMLAPAGLGALLGTAGALTTGRVWLGVAVPWDYAGAIAVLATVVAGLAAVAPAAWASRRDPVSVLRTP
nr:FtsX-like permease family protein [Actinomyces sp.]